VRVRAFLLLLVAACGLTACGGSHGSGPVPQIGAGPESSSAKARAAALPRIATAGKRATDAIAVSRRRAQSGTTAPNVTIADMPVPRPDTAPCVVPLFTGFTFSDFSPHAFAYTPPAACRPPWAKVVLEADLSITAGVQYDRTATIGLGGATIFFGTTSEPSSTAARKWHVERDLTELSALFTESQTGQITIGNIVNSTYTGVLGASGELEFYPPDRRYPAPRVADVVVPLADSNGNPVALDTTSSQLTKSFVPPANVEGAELQVISQSQIGDEFWYTCFPNDLATLLDNCGNTAFRETEIAVDGKPAGAAPVYPWIYTGGIDPFLWFPIPGVQTLDFVPYRVDLSPFAGTLDDGATHEVAISVYNADDYFSVQGNLLLFLDHGARGRLSGALDEDSLAAAPVESVREGGAGFNASGIGSGTIDTTSKRAYVITGHVLTSHGLVANVAQQTLSFTQHQNIVSSATGFAQSITQNTIALSTSSGHGGGVAYTRSDQFAWPLSLSYSYAVNADGTSAQTTQVRQSYGVLSEGSGDGRPALWAETNTVAPSDTLKFDASGNFTGNANNASSQLFTYFDSSGTCYGKLVKETNGSVTANAPVGCR